MRKKKKSALVPVLILVLVLILAADAAFIFTQYTWVAGGFHAKNSTVLDLRGKDLTVADYAAVTEQLPDCTVIWDVPFQGRRVASNSTTVAVTSLTEEDLDVMEYFTDLTGLNARGCRDYEALAAFRERFPDCMVTYTVPLSGQEYIDSETAVTIQNPDAAELMTGLPHMHALKDVTFTGTLPNGAQLRQLVQQFPDIRFHWQVSFEGRTLGSDTRELDLRQSNASAAALSDLLDSLPELEKVDLRGRGLTETDLIPLAEAHPGCLLLQNVTIAGETFSTDAEEIDLSGHHIGEAEIEAMLPCFPKLSKVVMSNCGLDDETMDGLNNRYDNIRFVWSVHIRNVELRTDAKFFYPYTFYHDMRVNEADLYPLRYCIDLEAIDIGHMSEVKTCDWLNYMPHMKYLILVETGITDISPLANLKELVFLEIFTTNIKDYTPLLGCTALEDLNLGKTYGPEEPILQMTWLKNLWWMGIEGTYGLPCSDAAPKLREALPYTTMKFNLLTPNVENGWRELDNYKAMRALMGVPCLA